MNVNDVNHNTAAGNPLAAAYYADQATTDRVEIVSNQLVADATWKLRFRSPEIAQRIAPGQFLMIRVAGTDDPLIGRPLAMYDIVDEECVEVVYVVMGNMTTRLSQLLAGTELDVWGPLGNGFAPTEVDHLVMAAGGIGHTPFLAVAKQHLGLAGYTGAPAEAYARRVTLCYGARNAGMLAGVEDFERAGVTVQIATDDGSAGHHGLVTDLLFKVIATIDFTATGEHAKKLPVKIVSCGPEPMMRSVSRIAAGAGLPCEVSLETPMACGIGICFSCVTRVRDSDGEWDYKRTCVDGPIFDANRIEW